MTALDRYTRLEAEGRWREGPAEPWRAVVVSFGNATLVLSDFEDHPLTHWALAAVAPLAEEEGRVVYAPDAGTEEVLEIGDEEMNRAIAEVTAEARALAMPRPRRGLVRRIGFYGILALLALATAFFGPDYLRSRVTALVSPEQAEMISDDIRAVLATPACTDQVGAESLARLATRVAPGVPVSVLAWGSPALAVLPDGTVLLSRDLVRGAASGEVIAGWIALGAGLSPGASGLHGWAAELPVADTLRFLTSGEAEAADVARMARLTSEGVGLPTPDLAAEAMETLAARGIDPRPFAADLRARGVTLELGAVGDDRPPVLSDDRDWVALQNICEG